MLVWFVLLFDDSFFDCSLVLLCSVMFCYVPLCSGLFCYVLLCSGLIWLFVSGYLFFLVLYSG